MLYYSEGQRDPEDLDGVQGQLTLKSIYGMQKVKKVRQKASLKEGRMPV